MLNLKNLIELIKDLVSLVYTIAMLYHNFRK